MVIADASDIDALMERVLLPSAPAALVDEVRRYLQENGSRGCLQASRNGADGNGASKEGPGSNGQGSRSRRDPWQVLHIALCAPQPVVDIAYAFWQGSRPSRPVSPPITAAPAQPATAQPATADDRLTGLNVPAMIPRASSNGALSTPAFIETASGAHRYGIADWPLRIGTDAGCDVVLPQSGPLEARIWPHGDRYMLRVVSGPVRVGGEAATWVVLDDGDILEIGDATFRFRLKDTP